MPVKIFFCYAHEDEALLIRLKTHLKPLERQNLIEVWYDREISAGAEWERETSQRLNEAQIILLLVSPDFMNSEYCYGIELKRALERHKRGEAQIIPVIGRAVYWQGVLGQLQALPKDAVPVTDPDWHGQDRTLYNVAEGVRKIVDLILQSQEKPKAKVRQQPAEQSGTAHSALPKQPAKQLSRRKVITGLAVTGAIVIGGGITWWEVWYQSHPLYTDRWHSDAVRSVAWSPNGSNRIASGSWDKTVHVWDAADGGNVYIYHGHSDEVSSVAWSLDSNYIVSGSLAKPVQVWEAK